MAKNDLRNLTIGKKAQFKTEIVVIEDLEFEVRAPSIKQREQLMTAAGMKPGSTGREADSKVSASEMQVLSVIFMTHDPKTGERVFDTADKDAMLEQAVGGWVDTLSSACMRMMQVKAPGEEAPGKNSDAILAEDSSSV